MGQGALIHQDPREDPREPMCTRTSYFSPVFCPPPIDVMQWMFGAQAINAFSGKEKQLQTALKQILAGEQVCIMPTVCV
jgi:hypothetical protein